MMTKHYVQTTFDMPWVVQVTLAHTNQTNSKRQKPNESNGNRQTNPLKVTVTESLHTPASIWNESLFFYKTGDKMLHSPTSSMYREFIKGEYNDVLARGDTAVDFVHYNIKYLDKNFAEAANLVLKVKYGTNSQGDVQMINIGVGSPGDNLIQCVEVSVAESQSSMYIGSLFYDLCSSERKECDIHTGKNGTKRGAGGVMLKVLTSICATLGFKDIKLADGSTFVDLETMPFAGNVLITPYLRALRGYGFYEGMGFFGTPRRQDLATAIRHQQAILNYHHKVYTTPIADLRSDSTLQPWEDDSLEENQIAQNDEAYWSVEEVLSRLDEVKAALDTPPMRKLFNCAFDRCSMRKVLQTFIALAEPYRPTAQTCRDSDVMISKWRAAFSDEYSKKDQLEREGWIALRDAAEHIVSFDTVFYSAAKLFFYTTETSVRGWHQTVASHLVVVPSDDGSAPRVVQENVDHRFRIDRLTDADTRLQPIPSQYYLSKLVREFQTSEQTTLAS